MASSRQLRVGILGTGRIADALVRAIRMSSNGELVAVASRDLSRAQAWASDRDVPRSFGSYDDLLASDEVDAVYVPLPNSLHKEWTIRAAQHGKHVLCEKPLATNAADARAMIEAADSNGVTLMEGFMYRFHPQYDVLRRLLSERRVGDVKMVRATFGFYLSRPDDIRWSKELGGGALLDVGCYCASAIRLLMGTEPVSATAGAVWASTGVDESLAGVLEFENGALAVLDCSFRTGQEVHQQASISGTEGLISIGQPFRTAEEPASIVVKSAGQTDVEVISVPGTYEYLRIFEDFADAALNRRPPSYTAQDSLHNLETLDALAESARTGHKVQIGR